MELYWIDKIFAKWRNFEVVANFFVKTVTGSMLYQPVSQWHSLHFELLIELVAQKLTELWRFKNLAYFLTWWPSSMTYLFVDVTYWNCSPIPYVDQVWWWYVKAFMSYAWQNWQTNRQTDRQTVRQTDRQMKGQSEIANMPKFNNNILENSQKLSKWLETKHNSKGGALYHWQHWCRCGKIQSERHPISLVSSEFLIYLKISSSCSTYWL